MISDPLLIELRQARAQRERADAKIRRLVAYERQFTWPRPYPLAQLATAAGMSISGFRTCYTPIDIDIDTAAANIGHSLTDADTTHVGRDRPAGCGGRPSVKPTPIT